MLSKFTKYIQAANLWAILVILWLFTGCNGCSKQDTVPADKKAIEKASESGLQVKLRRMEQELFSSDPAKAEETYARMAASYGYFWNVYVGNILSLGKPEDPATPARLKEFLEHKDMKDLFARSEKLYHDFGPYHKQLNEAFRLYNYYFPEAYLPEVVTFIGLLDFPNPYTDSVLGIGLDAYLGSDFFAYRSPGVDMPDFKIRKMTKDYIVINTVKALAYFNYEPDGNKRRFLDRMIQEGRILYFIDRLLPDMPDSIKIGYTGPQLKWCRDNEPMIWKHYLDKKLLYSTDMTLYGRYLNEAPFTAAPDVPPESSPQLGIWTGWQIVRKYMKEHPEVSLEALMKSNDFQKILEESKYKPR